MGQCYRYHCFQFIFCVARSFVSLLLYQTPRMIIVITVWEVMRYYVRGTSPGGNTPQDTNYKATCLPSRKLYKLDEPDTQDTAGEAKTNSSVMYSYGTPHMAKQNQDDQLEHTYSNYVRIRDEALKTCQKRWMTGRSGETGPGISVLVARHDDDDVRDYLVAEIFS